MRCFQIGYAISSLGLFTVASCMSEQAGGAGAATGAPALESQTNAAAELRAAAAAGAPALSPLESVAARYAQVAEAGAHFERIADAGAAPVTPRSDAAGPTDGLSSLELGATTGTRVQGLLPGRSSRTVVHEAVNEAENLFFTEDGRLFVSGGEDIYEITRDGFGTFKKSDHFDENCLVEGIVRSGNYLYGVCTANNDASFSAFLIAGELTKDPVFRTIAALDKASIPNGITVGPEGQLFITYTLKNQILRVTLSSPLQVERTEIWADNLAAANGIKYVDQAMYVTVLDGDLVGRFLRIPVLADGSAGTPVRLFERALTVLDDVLALDDGFIITDFLKGTLIFWDAARGVYGETPGQTFYSPTAIAQGRPPMFTERQLLVTEKGTLLLRDEVNGDLLSMYQLP
jgi:hypothetical protein